MKRYVRRILFWLIFCFFIITAPVAILYSQGYRFDQYTMIFVHSGSITIKSEPASANIYLDGELQATKRLDIINNSVTISGLRPASYTLRVSAEGYKAWEKKVDVHSGLSSEYWNVVLPPLAPVAVELDSRNVSRFFPSPFGKKVAYIEKTEDGVVLRVNTVNDNASKLVADIRDADYLDTRLENVEWNFKEDLLAVPISRLERKDYLIASSDSDMNPFFLSELENIKNPGKVRWSPQNKNILFFMAADSEKPGTPLNLYSMDIESKIPERVLADIQTYDISQENIYFLQVNNMLFRSNLEGSSNEQVTTSPFSEDALSGEMRLIVYDKDRQALITENGGLIIHNKGETGEIIQKISEGIQGVQFSDDGKKLLFWNNNQISVWFLRKWDVQPYRDENNSETIMRLSTPVTNVFWYQDYEHAFFTTKSKIKLVELDSRDQRNCLEILENDTENFPAAYDANAGLYYFLKEQNGERKIYYIEIPEKKGFFG